MFGFTFQKSLEDAECGSDLDTVQSLTEEHEQLYQEVQGFRREIERCIMDGVSDTDSVTEGI